MRSPDQRQAWVEEWLEERRRECAVLTLSSVAEWLPICMSCSKPMAQGTKIFLDASGEEFCDDTCFDHRHTAEAWAALLREEENDGIELAELERGK